MKKALSIGGVLVGLTVLLFGGVGAWASSESSNKLAQKFETHVIELEVPTPLSDEDLADLRGTKAAEYEKAGKALVNEDGAKVDVLIGVDLGALAQARAVARGKHLVEARYVCVECHGQDFGGGVMVDDPALGSLLGPNITSGKGGVVANYKTSDWDRIVRHGVKPDGTPAVMPSEDFVRMSDNELADIITYIQSVPPVDTTIAASSLGPLGMVFMAAGQFPLFAENLPDHQAAHVVEPPKPAPTAEFGQHLTAVCVGCHRADFDGGPIASGPPDWPAAANITPGPEGIEGWTFEQFDQAMRLGKRPDGTVLKMPMSLVTPYMAKTTEVEMKAMWIYLESVKPMPDGE